MAILHTVVEPTIELNYKHHKLNKVVFISQIMYWNVFMLLDRHCANMCLSCDSIAVCAIVLGTVLYSHVLILVPDVYF